MDCSPGGPERELTGRTGTFIARSARASSSLMIVLGGSGGRGSARIAGRSHDTVPGGVMLGGHSYDAFEEWTLQLLET